jgi:hypothetical protein
MALPKRRWRWLAVVAAREPRLLLSLSRLCALTRHPRGEYRTVCSSWPADRGASHSYDKWLGHSFCRGGAGVTAPALHPYSRARRLSLWVLCVWLGVRRAAAPQVEAMDL